MALGNAIGERYIGDSPVRTNLSESYTGIWSLNNSYELVKSQVMVNSINYWFTLIGGSGDDIAYDIATDLDGNVYVCGSTTTSGSGGSDFLTIKINAFGILQWQRILGDSNNNVFKSIDVDSSGNVYICGDSTIVKYSTFGVLEWQRTWTSIGLSALTVDSSGNVYVTGNGYNLSSISTGDGVLIKYSSSGTIIWKRYFGVPYSPGPSESDGTSSVFADNSGYVYVFGGGVNSGRYVSKVLGADGSIIWIKTLYEGMYQSWQNGTVDSSGNVYACGMSNSNALDILVSKYDSTGLLIWQKSLGGAAAEMSYDISSDSSGNIYVCGSTASQGSGSTDAFVTKINPSDGSILWQRTIGGTSGEIAYGITVDFNNSVYLCGITSSMGYGNNDIFISKLNPSGTLTGNYGSLSYNTSTLTSSTTAFSVGTISIVSAGTGISDSAGSFIGTSINLSSTLLKVS